MRLTLDQSNFTHHSATHIQSRHIGESENQLFANLTVDTQGRLEQWLDPAKRAKRLQKKKTACKSTNSSLNSRSGRPKLPVEKKRNIAETIPIGKSEPI